MDATLHAGAIHRDDGHSATQLTSRQNFSVQFFSSKFLANDEMDGSYQTIAQRREIVIGEEPDIDTNIYLKVSPLSDIVPGKNL